MKIFFVIAVCIFFLAPTVGMSFQNLKTHTKMGKDKQGGYTETQKDYKSRMNKRDQEKQKGGYYQGEYHNKSPEFQQKKYQFVESGNKKSSKKKK